MKLIKNDRIFALLVTMGTCLAAEAQFTLTGINTTVGIASTLQSINANTAAMLEAKNQANRVVLRGTRLSEPASGQGGIDPSNSGGQPEVGGEVGVWGGMGRGSGGLGEIMEVRICGAVGS